MINREELIDQHEEFSLWWQLPEQEELRKSCAAGWAFRVWQASRETLEIALPILEQQEQGEGEWIHWNGEMALPPVDSHVRVEVRRRNGGVNQRQAQDFAWRNQPVKSGTDIIAYRIIPEQPTNQNGEK